MQLINAITEMALVPATSPLGPLASIKARSATYRALHSFDPDEAELYENAVILKQIPKHDYLAEVVTTQLRNQKYWRLTPLRSTALFGKKYDDLIYRSFEEESPAREGLMYMSKADVCHLWRARQQADLLGMEYEPYIETAIDVHFASDKTYIPQPKDLYTPTTLAAAALLMKFGGAHGAS